MCIVNSVGKHATNNRDDVKTIQILLNLNLGSLLPFPPLSADGGLGARTVAIIGEFQRRVVRSTKPDGRVSPNGPTLQKLRQGMASGFSLEKLGGIMIHASAATMKRYYSVLAADPLRLSGVRVELD